MKYGKIIVASDSFKGSFSSLDVAEAVENAVSDLNCNTQVIKLPMADGGEGSLFALVSALGGRYIECDAHDALMRRVLVKYGVINDCAVIEMAAVCGLTMLDVHERNPLNTTTYGVGEVIHHALLRGYKRFLITIGGSASNDAGLGAMQALGLNIFDDADRLLPIGINGGMLSSVARFDFSSLKEIVGDDVRFDVACDVNNPFCGVDGAAYVFAPQKGADADDVRVLDFGLQHVATLINDSLGLDIASAAGAGAAGGLGGGLMAFLSARLMMGAEIILDYLKFDDLLADADLVITGEGRVDSQTLRGKVVSAVVRHAEKYGVPVLVLAGSLADDVCSSDKRDNVTFVQVTPKGQPLSLAMKPYMTRSNIIYAVKRFLNGGI